MLAEGSYDQDTESLIKVTGELLRLSHNRQVVLEEMNLKYAFDENIGKKFTTMKIHRNHLLVVLFVLLQMSFGNSFVNAASPESPAKDDCGSVGPQSASHVFYVSPKGNDAWSGVLASPNMTLDDGPFATLARAKEVVKELRKSKSVNQPVQVIIKEGMYNLAEPLVFRPEDSGTESSELTFMAASGEEVIISGGKVLTGFKEISENLWRLRIPEVKEGSWIFRQLFRENKRLTRARIPEEGWFYLEPVSESIGGDLGKHQEFHVKEGEIEEYDNLHQAELVVYNRWNNSRLFIESIDEENQICRFKGEIWRGPKEGKRFHIENIREGLTRPDTWYLDYDKGLLYIRTEEDPNDNSIVAPALETLVEFRGDYPAGKFVSHITMKDLSFRYSSFPVGEMGIRGLQAANYLSGAIYAEAAQYITIENCEIKSVGQYGVDIGPRSHHCRVIHNRFTDLGAGGVRLGTTTRSRTDELVSYNNIISDNYIAEGGKTAFGAVGIFAANCRYTTISHNEVTRMKYTGISVGWDWNTGPNHCRDNTIEKNYVHHIGMNILADMGGIYTLGLSPGTSIRGNIIHDVWPYMGSGRGIYLDEGSVGYIVENNIVYNTFSPSIRFQIGTAGNIVKNNIFALAKEGVLGYDTDRFNVLHRNIIFWTEGPLFSKNRIHNFNQEISNNLYWNPDDSDPEFAGYSFEEWRKQRRPKLGFVTYPSMDHHSIYADPKFKNPAKGDFTLLPDSPAFQLGFEPIDTSDVGPREYK